MSLLERIIGRPRGAKGAPQTETPESIVDALARLRAERVSTEARLEAIAAERREALLADAAADSILALDAEAAALEIAVEKLEMVEPVLLGRLSVAQGEARRAEFEALRETLFAAESRLDAAMNSCAEATEAYLENVRAFDARGFELQARGAVVLPPLVGLAVLAGAAPLENWRRERERRDDAHAQRPIKNHFQQPTVEPVLKPVVRMVDAQKPVGLGPPAEPVAAKPRRPLKTVGGEIAFGFQKMVSLRNGLEIAGEQMVAGDEFVATADDAKSLMESGAAEIVARGTLDDAAE